MKNLCIIFFSLVFLSCNQLQFPDKVEKVLMLAGENRSELEKTLQHYQNDDLKYKAACFLVGNMGSKHSYITFALVDSTENIIPWNILQFENYDELLDAWDSLENQRGKIHFHRKKHIPDHEVIKADYLIRNIDQAFEAWQLPWASHLSFEQFCEYILPYRSTNEPLEDWRSYFLKEYTWLKDSMLNSDDPIKACTFINSEIRSWFNFDERYYEHPTDQGLSELLEKKMGRCEDMTNLAIMAMRSWGIAVMSDYTPYWANTGNNHAWNAILDKDGKTIIFMGGEANPLAYQLKNKKAKVYRKTFARQPDNIVEVKNSWERVPKYLNNSSQIDVTNQYDNVADVALRLTVEKPDSVDYAYLCVFNSGEWKAIASTKVRNENEVNFKDMGLDIVYLPAFFKNENIIPAGPSFLLDKQGEVKELMASESELHNCRLSTTTRRTSGQTTDDIGTGNLKENKIYQLFYWAGKWKMIMESGTEKGYFYAENIPVGALLWFKEKDGREEERIFTLENKALTWW